LTTSGRIILPADHPNDHPAGNQAPCLPEFALPDVPIVL
jgi:hypothetical protein